MVIDGKEYGLVPAVPTQEMESAGRSLGLTYSVNTLWRIMFAAAPELQQPDQCSVCGSDSNELDELIKAEREIQWLQIRIAELEDEVSDLGYQLMDANER